MRSRLLIILIAVMASRSSTDLRCSVAMGFCSDMLLNCVAMELLGFFAVDSSHFAEFCCSYTMYVLSIYSLDKYY